MSYNKQNIDLKMELARQKVRQIALSHHVKISESRISLIINGWVKPKLEEKEKIANFLKVNVSDIFRADDE